MINTEELSPLSVHAEVGRAGRRTTNPFSAQTPPIGGEVWETSCYTSAGPYLDALQLLGFYWILTILRGIRWHN